MFIKIPMQLSNSQNTHTRRNRLTYFIPIYEETGAINNSPALDEVVICKGKLISYFELPPNTRKLTLKLSTKKLPNYLHVTTKMRSRWNGAEIMSFCTSLAERKYFGAEQEKGFYVMIEVNGKNCRNLRSPELLLKV